MYIATCLKYNCYVITHHILPNAIKPRRHANRANRVANRLSPALSHHISPWLSSSFRLHRNSALRPFWSSAHRSMKMDVLGTIMIGTITAVGGGTIRDAIILRNGPFWTEEADYTYLYLATAATTFATTVLPPPTLSLNRKETKLEFAPDSLDVCAFCVIGVMNGVRMKMPPVVCAFCGMATATFGGVVRDVLCT